MEKNKERFQEAQNEIKLLLKEKDRLLHQLRGGNQSFQEGLTNNDDDDERTSAKREISGFGDYERRWREPLERGSEERPKFDFKLYNENNNDRFDHPKGLCSSIESFRQKFERENENSGLGLTSDRGYEDEREWRLNSESERRGKQELTFRLNIYI